MPAYKYTRLDKRIEIEEAKAIIDSLEAEDMRVIVALLYLTGARVSEVLALTSYAVKIGHKEVEITVPSLKRPDIKKAGAFLPSRPLTFKRDAPFMDIIARHVKHVRRIKVDKLFTYKRFKVWYELKKVTQKCSPHSFRHSRLQKLADLGATQSQIKAFAGHSRLDSSTAYIEASKVLIAGVKDLIE